MTERNVKCLLTGKSCPFSPADFLYGYGERCPIERYRNSDHYLPDGTIEEDAKCRYRGVVRWETDAKRRNYVDGGKEKRLVYERSD